MDNFLRNFRTLLGASGNKAKKSASPEQEEVRTDEENNFFKKYFSLPNMLKWYEERSYAPELLPENARPGTDVDIRGLYHDNMYGNVKEMQERGSRFLASDGPKSQSARNGFSYAIPLGPAAPDEKAIHDDRDYDFVNATKDDFYADLGSVMLGSNPLDVSVLTEKYGNRSDFYNRLINRLQNDYLKNIKAGVTPGSPEWQEGLSGLYEDYRNTVPGYLLEYDLYRRAQRV